MAENIARRLDERERQETPGSVAQTVLAAALEVERPVFFSFLWQHRLPSERSRKLSTGL
jgi:cobalt-zinc-cadmium resistance protein CzcA